MKTNKLTKAIAIALLTSTVTISSVGCNITPKENVSITTQVENILDNEQEVYFNDGILAVKVYYSTPVLTLEKCFKEIDTISKNVDLSEVEAIQYWAVDRDKHTLFSCTMLHDELESLSATYKLWTNTKAITKMMQDLYISSYILDTLDADTSEQIIYNTYYKKYSLPDVDLYIPTTGKLYQGKK